jgi:Bacteriophage probable baseplate hub protein
VPPRSTPNPVPDVAVSLGGRDLPPRAYRDLLEVEVHDDVEGPSMFTLCLSAWDKDRLDYAWVDDDLFALGAEVEISLGQVDSLGLVFEGEVTGVELELAAGEVPSLVVRGYDRRHRLLRGTKTRSFVNMRDGDIASQIAQENGLGADVADDGPRHEYVLQHGQSDLAFLSARAEAIGFEVTMAGRSLRFAPRRHGEKPALVLEADRDLVELSARLSARDQPGGIDVRGWDARNKEAIVGRASRGQETAMGPGGGPAAADRAFGKAVFALVDRPVLTREEADRLALGRLERLALEFVRGEGRCVGRPELKAGIVVEVRGAGRRFSGPYYVTSTTHAYAPRRGYTTSFSIRRNAT